MINLELALRASEAKRWAIVKLTRDQSVAEHQYRVYLIADAISEALGVSMHNSLDAQAIRSWALTHDLHEVLTGDLPTPVKATDPALVARLEAKARATMGLPLGEAHDKTIVGFVVKIADLVEALLFLHENGGHDRQAVWRSVQDRYAGTVTMAQSLFWHHNWAMVPPCLISCRPDDPVWAEAITMKEVATSPTPGAAVYSWVEAHGRAPDCAMCQDRGWTTQRSYNSDGSLAQALSVPCPECKVKKV